MNNRQLLPAEKLVLYAGALALVLVLCGYPLLLPATQEGAILEKLTGTSNYLFIILSVVVLYVLIFLARKISDKQMRWQHMFSGTVILLRMLAAVAASMYLMLCFKWWSHLHSTRFDDFYQQIDERWSWITDGFMQASHGLGLSDDLYYYLFTLLFISAYAVVMVLSPAWFCRMLTATTAVSLIGGVAYMIAPAYGPFLFRDNDYFMQTQAMMYEATDLFRQSGGSVFDASKFEYVLGAMPSLHIAQALVMLVYASTINQRLLVPYLLIFGYLVIHASTTGFHYLLDIPAGFVVAGLSVWITEALHKRPYMS